MPFSKSQMTFDKDKQREDASIYISSALKAAKDSVGSPIFNAETGKTGRIINAMLENGNVVLLSNYPA